ncbi:transposase [Magnetovirga frankeli]|nr:transposase [gamma proteobacterium SS-5]
MYGRPPVAAQIAGGNGKYDPAIHHRRSIRLQGYDYSQAGAYFVTLCTQDRECLFGDIVNGEMRMNDAGKMIQAVWDEIPANYPGVDIDSFIVMPNHIHGIVVIVGAAPRGRPDSAYSQDGQARGPIGQPQGVAPTRLSLPDMVHRFKTMTTKRYADGVKRNGWSTFPGKLWQRNYWEHIVRNEPELNRIREYIHNNPAQWELDKLHPNNPVGAGLKPAPTPARNPAPTEIREPTTEYGMEAWMV